MGHHKPSFTMDRYGHLMEGDELPALDVLPSADLELVAV
jgi:hypothetical protein